jgi:FkbM family methyltransferase
MFRRFKWTKVAEERIAILKLYEPLQPYLLLELTDLAKADTFVDAGANVGAYSILISSLDCITSVHAFEPSPRTSEELAVNVALNEQAHKVTLHKTALSDTESNARFGIVGDYSGANGVVDTSIHPLDKFATQVTVCCVPLDSVLTFRDRTISLKIDVEGHEKAVLAGARGLLTGNRGIMQIESYESWTAELAEVLESYGYRLIFHAGPDHYCTNMELNDHNIVGIFEKAASHLIKSNFEPPVATRNARLKLPGGVTVEIPEALANGARKLKASVTGRPLHFWT